MNSLGRIIVCLRCRGTIPILYSWHELVQHFLYENDLLQLRPIFGDIGVNMHDVKDEAALAKVFDLSFLTVTGPSEDNDHPHPMTPHHHP